MIMIERFLFVFVRQQRCTSATYQNSYDTQCQTDSSPSDAVSLLISNQLPLMTLLLGLGQERSEDEAGSYTDGVQDEGVLSVTPRTIGVVE